MEQNSTRRDFLLGMVFFGALTMLLYYTIVLTGFSLDDKFFLNASFANASGLKEGDAVLIAGRPTGKVREVSYHDGSPDAERIGVRMEFNEPVTLHQGYGLRISEFTVLGGRVVEIDPGPAEAAVIPLDTPLFGVVGTSAIAALGELVAENRDRVNIIIGNLETASTALAEGRGPLGALINSAEMRTQLEDFLDTAGGLAADIRQGKGIFGLLATDEEARSRLQETLRYLESSARDLEEISRMIASGEGLLGAAIHDQALQADAMATVSDLRTAAAELRTMLSEANQGRGLFGELLTNPTLAADAASFLANLNHVSERLVDGQGTVGKLLTEELAYDELIKALQLLTGSLEDVREAQPVSSFVGMLFGNGF